MKRRDFLAAAGALIGAARGECAMRSPASPSSLGSRACRLTARRAPGADYTWDTVRLGGGGYVTGLVFHSREPGLVYARTDVGGAYRWEASDRRWVPLTDWVPRSQHNLMGIAGLAVDPQNPDVVYLAAGRDPDSAPSDVLRSTDRGRTWTRTGLDRPFAGNGLNRWKGECIAVDPLDRDVVYVGTPFDGLWRTHNATSAQIAWERVPEAQVPSGPSDPSNPRGPKTLVFDAREALGGRSAVLYVGMPGRGVYRTADAGETWTLLDGAPRDPARMRLSPAGPLYVAADQGLFRWRDGAWTDLSPEPGRRYGGVDVDPSNPARLVASRHHLAFDAPVYYSEDGGTHWREVTEGATLAPEVTWWREVPERFAAATATVRFDPHDPHAVWFSDWFGVWRTDDVTEQPAHFVADMEGLEEMVIHDLAAPSKGAHLLSVMADNDGMRSVDVSAYPLDRFLGPKATDGTGIDFCEEDPDLIVRLVSYHWGREGGSGGYSRDNGITWTEFASYPTGPDGERLANGKVAVGARKLYDGHPAVVAVPYGQPAYVSHNLGATWTRVSGPPANTLPHIWNPSQPVAADRVDGRRFYLYADGRVWVSTDGGRHFSRTAALPRAGRYAVEAAPGLEGEVWVGVPDGLYRSGDAAAHFRRLPAVGEVVVFAFGKARPRAEKPAVYVYGRVQGRDGIFRSDDMGQTWIRISGPRIASPRVMAADRQTYGVVYIGTGGRGVFVGKPRLR